ncbi:glycosyltransferase involved in cell wall biosynthesis [Neorhizobium galegae]|uniref:glycosyltransferase n=1 Tax=Neorhizobium galegae TaxID=399 RepID=UPI001AE8185E|nr:glycosyltransferase [Neorhizobium galegae]MBP2550525.1 glycosyltransferase involved in cell wall biosynthesis [Neorhizobium galegae]
MRILRVVSSLNPAAGGVVEAVRSTTIGLMDLGHEVEVVTLDKEGQAFLSDFPCLVHPVDRWFRKYGYTPKLTQWIAQHGGEYDVGVIEGLWNHASIGGYQGMKSANLPYIVFPHGMMDPWFRVQSPVKHVAKQFFWWVFQGRVLGGAKAVAFTCDEERRSARNVFWGPAYTEETIPLGIPDVPPFSQNQARCFLELVPAVKGRRYALFMSRIHPKKGCDLLIEAFSKVADEHPDLDLVMAGPDQLGWKAELVELSHKLGIASRIHWPGMLEGDAKWGAVYEADVFVLPSHQENFGLVIPEAMACGTPVLTTRRVNIWREVEETGAAIIKEDTREGVLDLLQSWNRLPILEKNNFKIAARQGFLNQFHIDGSVRRLADLLEKSARPPSGADRTLSALSQSMHLSKGFSA